MFNVLTREEIGHFIKATGPDGKGAQFYEMTGADIAEMVAGFYGGRGQGQAGRLRRVEIHAGHGYLLATFLSPTLTSVAMITAVPARTGRGSYLR